MRRKFEEFSQEELLYRIEKCIWYLEQKLKDGPSPQGKHEHPSDYLWRCHVFERDTIHFLDYARGARLQVMQNLRMAA